MAAPVKSTQELVLRVPKGSILELERLVDFAGKRSKNHLATDLLLAILGIVQNPEMNPPLPFELIALREKLHGPGRSGTYIDEPGPSAVVREDPTVEERRVDSLAELALLDRILGLNEKLQNQVLDLQAQLLECRNAQDRLRDENQRLREGGR